MYKSKNWIRAGLLAMGLAVPFMAANAQFDPPGSQSTCDAKGTTDIVSATYTGVVPHDGSGTFVTLTSTPSSTVLRAIQVKGTGFDPVLGNVVWEADIPRTDAAGLRTTVNANQPGSTFPATGRFEFFARLITNGNVVYESTTPVVMTATLTQWPHNNALYRSVGPVTYRRVNVPTQTITTPKMDATVTAQGAPFQRPVGTVSSCSATGSTTVVTPTVTREVPFTGGLGTFETVSNSQPGTPASTSLRALEVTAVGTDQVLGEVAWSADIARTNEAGLLTTITANQTGVDFPATGTFQFYGRITLSSQPGVVYRSRTPVTLTATLTSWPHNNTAYSSTGPVVYERVGNPNITITTPVMNPTMTAQ